VAEGEGPEFKPQYHKKKKWLSMVAHVYNPSSLGCWGRRISIWRLGQIKVSKILSQKQSKTGGVAQAVDRLSSKLEDLSWNPSIAKKQKQNKIKKKEGERNSSSKVLA
jgi:hypothetical protein